MSKPSPSSLQTEKQFMAAVVEYARLNGFLCYHTFDSRRSEPGFPDIVCTDGSRVVFAELKVGKGKLSEAQKRWGFALSLVSESPDGAVEYHVWCPKDWPVIESVLTKGAA